ncbi:uncharacterized protein An03g05180 [Aspergillus niger]|uniref:Contig An03c0160, genomic contig n=2 Tax=Aspergillus niger TaxID=5061 RepID=A2QH10_ASPNC|nr:uncharacterized protein An03g05180 [Aspergillus niger]CAK49170.1 unnamed protein product [Aspergillus niger]
MEREAGIPEGERSGAMRLVAGSSHRRGYHPPQPDALTRLDDEQWSPAQGQAGGQFDADRVVVAPETTVAGQARYVLDLIEPLGGGQPVQITSDRERKSERRGRLNELHPQLRCLKAKAGGDPRPRLGGGRRMIAGDGASGKPSQTLSVTSSSGARCTGVSKEGCGKTKNNMPRGPTYSLSNVLGTIKELSLLISLSSFDWEMWLSRYSARDGNMCKVLCTGGLKTTFDAAFTIVIVFILYARASKSFHQTDIRLSAVRTISRMTKQSEEGESGHGQSCIMHGRKALRQRKPFPARCH